ncbi:MAG: choice-of-anchor Q domain-containing protein, partial [Bacteroidota bacterium]
GAVSGDTIMFDPLITDGIPIALTSGEILIDKSLVIIGNGAAQTSIAGSTSRIFNISAAGEVRLENLALVNGQSTGNGGAIASSDTKLMLDNCLFSLNEADSSGAAVYHQGDSLIVSNCQMIGNTAHGNASTDGGGAIYHAGGVAMIQNNSEIRNNTADGSSGSGGGIFNGMNGELLVMDSRIVSNSAMRAGGGIEDNSGAGTMVTLTNVVLDSNATSMAPGNGGGFHITGPGDAMITGGTVNGNTASNQGGGVWNGTGLMTINQVSIENNLVTGGELTSGGGGIYNLGGEVRVMSSTIAENECSGTDARGGGIFNPSSGIISVSYSTISGNEVIGNGGGISNAGEASLVAVSLINNQAGAEGGGILLTEMNATASISSSIIATNMGSSGVDLAAQAGTYTSVGYNLIGQDDANVFPEMSSDQEGMTAAPLDPMVEPLNDNGGGTRTHALMDGSPARDAGDPQNNDPDQRNAGVVNGQRDAGSYEYDGIISSVENISQADFSHQLYPNPLRGRQLNLLLQGRAGTPIQVQILELASGKTVYRTELQPGEHTVHLPKLTPGTFVVLLIQMDRIESHKLILLK